MGNASEMFLFVSRISKGNDFLIGTLYTIFGKWFFFTRFTAFNPMNLCIFQHCHVLLLCLPGVLSVLGNGTLLFVVYRKKSSLKPAEFFVVNLAISDLSMSITLFPLAIPSAFAHMWVNANFPIAISPYHLLVCHLSYWLYSWETKNNGKEINKWWNFDLRAQRLCLHSF